MNWEAWVAQYGVWGLGVAAYVGATLVPVSSEVAVVAALKLGVPPWQVLVSASVGNALGALTNYGLGRLLAERVYARLAGQRAGSCALRAAERYGRWSLLGSWLPVVGDPLCLAAGALRIGLPFFVLVGIGTRIARYVVLLVLSGAG